MMAKGVKLQLIAVLLGAGLLAGCTRAGQPELVTAAVPVEAPRTVGPATVASREHQRILDAYGGAYSDPELQAYVATVATRLAASSERPDVTYRVTILNSPAANAFALPNGQLYVTRGLLALASDSSELAAVIAHEMAHVTARHGVQRADQERQAVLVSRVVSDVLSDPQAGAAALAKSKIALASFSRSQELEADQIGIRTVAKAGYDPYGASRFLGALGGQSRLTPSAKGDQNLDFMSSHPSTPERVNLAISAARQFGAPGIGESDRLSYLAAIDGITYGDDPSQGVSRGRKFSHPTLGFTFTAPDAFVFDNGSDAVLGIAPDGRALRLDTVTLEQDQSLENYLSSGWIEGVDVGVPEPLTVNGLPAATVIAKGRDWTFRLVAIRLGSSVYRIIYATKSMTPLIDQEFRASFDTFRKLSPSEISAIKPLRIRVVTVGRNDTVETLARRMQDVDRPVERFLTLNGMRPNDEVKPGARVKILAE